MGLEKNPTQPLLTMEFQGLRFDIKRLKLVRKCKVTWVAWKDGNPVIHEEIMYFGSKDLFDFQIPTDTYLDIVRHTLTQKAPKHKKS